MSANAAKTTTKICPPSGSGRPLSRCMGCRRAIQDQYILRVAPDMEWHAACLKCNHCHRFLDETCTCFVREGKTYCKGDYLKLFGAKCDKCFGGFSKTEMVMRATNKIFHVRCFRCSACEKQLQPGDEFALRENCLFCRNDYDSIKDESIDEDEMLADNHSTEITEELEFPKEETPSRPSTGGSDFTVASDSDRVVPGARIRTDSSGRIKKSEGKATRIRTVLTEKQLHTLRTCYNANPRPDALMKEQLVEMTGLNSRVIRVWFQNKRCKDKKRAIYMKNVHMQQEKGNRFGPYGSMQGIPLVASPPSHADPNGGVPFDVTGYQPPWKTLTDFALTHHDLERIDPSNPQYQQVLQQMHGYGIEHETMTHIPQGGVCPPNTHGPTFTNMDDGMRTTAPSYGPPSNPPFPGTPSEISSTSSE